MWVKNITDFWRFCYLNIPCLRMNITLIFMSYSSEEFTNKLLDHWESALYKYCIYYCILKLKNRCFCWFPAAIFVLACVVGVKRGRGRGNLGARAREAREGEKERNACKDAIVFSVFHGQILSVKIVIGQN